MSKFFTKAKSATSDLMATIDKVPETVKDFRPESSDIRRVAGLLVNTAEKSFLRSDASERNKVLNH